MWASEPTWANHVPLLGGAGLQLKSYPYYDAARKDICFDEMLDALNHVPNGDLVLLHGCCHNPTGMDLSRDQWQAVADIVVERDLVPCIDIAYQGFADGLEEEALYHRALANILSEPRKVAIPPLLKPVVEAKFSEERELEEWVLGQRARYALSHVIEAQDGQISCAPMSTCNWVVRSSAKARM